MLGMNGVSDIAVSDKEVREYMRKTMEAVELLNKRMEAVLDVLDFEITPGAVNKEIEG